MVESLDLYGRTNPRQKHNQILCNNKCDGKQYMKIQGGQNSWFYCKCVCHTSNKR